MSLNFKELGEFFAKITPKTKTPTQAFFVIFTLLIAAVAATLFHHELFTFLENETTAGIKLVDVVMGETSTYSVHVTVVNQQDQLTEESNVESTVKTEKEKIKGGWQIDISKKNLPADHLVEFRATVANDFLAGKSVIELRDDYHPSVKIIVVPDHSAGISGTVVDRNGEAIKGAKIWTTLERPVFTDQQGTFSLPPNYGNGQPVELYVHYEHIDQQQSVNAGTTQVQVRLD